MCSESFQISLFFHYTMTIMTFCFSYVLTSNLCILLTFINNNTPRKNKTNKKNYKAFVKRCKASKELSPVSYDLHANQLKSVKKELVYVA